MAETTNLRAIVSSRNNERLDAPTPFMRPFDDTDWTPTMFGGGRSEFGDAESRVFYHGGDIDWLTKHDPLFREIYGAFLERELGSDNADIVDLDTPDPETLEVAPDVRARARMEETLTGGGAAAALTQVKRWLGMEVGYSYAHGNVERLINEARQIKREKALNGGKLPGRLQEMGYLGFEERLEKARKASVDEFEKWREYRLLLAERQAQHSAFGWTALKGGYDAWTTSPTTDWSAIVEAGFVPITAGIGRGGKEILKAGIRRAGGGSAVGGIIREGSKDFAKVAGAETAVIGISQAPDNAMRTELKLANAVIAGADDDVRQQIIDEEFADWWTSSLFGGGAAGVLSEAIPTGVLIKRYQSALIPRRQKLEAARAREAQRVEAEAQTAARAEGKTLNPRVLTKEDYDAATKSPEIMERLARETDAAGRKYDGVAEEGSERQMRFDKGEPVPPPRKVKRGVPPQTPGSAKGKSDDFDWATGDDLDTALPPNDDLPTTADGELTPEAVNERAAQIASGVPVAKTEFGGGNAPMPLTAAAEGAPSFRFAGRDYAGELSAEGQAALPIAEEAYNLYRAAGGRILPPEDIFAVQDGRLVFRGDIAREGIDQMSVAYAMDSPFRPKAGGSGNPITDAFAGQDTQVAELTPITPQGEAGQVQQNTDRAISAAVANIPSLPKQRKRARGRYERAVSEGRRDEINSVYGERSGSFYKMADAILEGGGKIDGSEQTKNFLDYAFKNGAAANDRAGTFGDLQKLAEQLPDGYLADDARKADALAILQKVGEAQDAAKTAADILENVVDAASARLNDDGSVSGTRADGVEVTRDDINVSAAGDTNNVRRRKQIPYSEDPLVMAVRSGEWKKGKPSRAYRARQKEVPSSPFITFILSGGASLTNRNARSGRWRGLKLPERTKFGRRSRGRKGMSELGLAWQDKGLPPGFWNNAEGLNEEQLKDFSDGGILSDIIAHNFPQTLREDGSFDFDQVEDGLVGIIRAGIEADMQRSPLLSKADEEFVEMSPDDWESGMSAYEIQTRDRAMAAEVAEFEAIGFAPRDEIAGIRAILRSEGVEDFTRVSEIQVHNANRLFESQEAERLHILRGLRDEGVDINQYYNNNKAAIDAEVEARGLQESQRAQVIIETMSRNGDLPSLPPRYFDEIPPMTPEEAAAAVARADDDGAREWNTIAAGLDTRKATREAATVRHIPEKPKMREPGADEGEEFGDIELTGTAAQVFAGNPNLTLGNLTLRSIDGNRWAVRNGDEEIGTFDSFNDAVSRFIRAKDPNATDAETHARIWRECIIGGKK